MSYRRIKRRRPPVELLEPRILLDSTAVFSELMFNPGDDQDLEWIEIHSEMAVDLDISSWRIEGVGFTFPANSVLNAGQSFVIAKSPASFTQRYGFVPDHGPYSGRLNNGGETLRLINNSDRVMDRIRYDDEWPWPVEADGSGASLVKIDLDGGSNSVDNWTHSHRVGGTPKSSEVDNSSSSIVFHEVSERDGDQFFVELKNVSQQAQSLAGYSIKSDAATGTVNLTGELQPGELQVIRQEQFPFSTVEVDRLFLYSDELNFVADAVRMEDTPQQKIDTGEFADRWLTPITKSPGDPNTVAIEDDLVINEILYHAPGTAVDGKPALVETTSLLPIATTDWRYRVSNEGLDPSWYTENHTVGVDSWQSGNGLFGYERTPLGIPIRTEFPNPATVFPPIITYYFETDFELIAEEIAKGEGIALRHMVDDGAVIYLNGQEAVRYNMPDGPIDSGTFADSIPNATLSDTIVIPEELLRVGSNRISVEVHQASVASNDIIFGAEILQSKVISDAVPGQPYTTSNEEWIEIFNRSETESIDLANWKIDGGVEFTFPENATIGPGEYRLIARDAVALTSSHPDLAAIIVGEFSGRLANNGETIRLVDQRGNPADELRYHDGGRWHEFADGGGSSLELRSPFANNRSAESWGASSESEKSQWQTIVYEETVKPDGFSGSTSDRFHELIMGMLDGGEVLIDDVSVLENGVGGIERIQNGSFDGDALGSTPAHWRIAGNHSGLVIPDPDNAGNQVLKLTATGGMEDRYNHAETTFADRARIRDGVNYRISYRAKWLGGSNQVHSRLFFDKLPNSVRVSRPETIGTPGRQNSIYAENIGPTLSALSHSPVLPAAGEAVTVSVRAEDPDEVQAVRLHYSVDDGRFNSVAMMPSSTHEYMAIIPGQSNGDVVQFYVQAEDSRGSNSVFPAEGAASRALYQVPSQNARSGIHNFRIIMTPDDTSLLHNRTNVVSNGHLGATVVYNESEVFYDVGVRLRGSNAGRSDASYLGFQVAFDPMHRFRGVHNSVVIDRSGRSSPTPRTQDEIIIKHIANAAGDIPHMYDDLVHVIAPRRSHTRSALLLMARYGNDFLDSQYENGSDGTVYKLDIAYIANGTLGGNPENAKIPSPYSHPSPTRDLEDLGDDKEAYRSHLMIRNNRDADDYETIIRASQALDRLRSNNFDEAAELIDVDQWARVFALQSLTGAADAYTRGGLHHNIQFYTRPSDNRVLALPWDWDFAFTASTRQSLIGATGTGGRLMNRPIARRLYHGHLLDIVNTTYNNEYLDRWIDHYGQVARQNLGSIKNYVRTRSQYVLSRLPDPIDFTITTNNGSDFESSQPQVKLAGRGWINVREIRVNDEPVNVQWQDDERWEIELPLSGGQNALTLVAIDHRGAEVGRDSINVAHDLVGDIDGNGELDANDIDTLAAAIRLGEEGNDLNDDGHVDLQDHAFLITEILQTSYGDADLSRDFVSADLVLVFQAGEYEDTIVGNSGWIEGDWDGDGDFTSSDLVAAFQSGRYEA